LKENMACNSKPFILISFNFEPCVIGVSNPKMVFRLRTVTAVTSASVKDAQLALSKERTASQNGCRIRQEFIFSEKVPSIGR